MGLIGELQHQLESEEFKARHRVHPTDFTRDRSLTFVNTFALIANLCRSSLQTEANNFFARLFNDHIPRRHVTASALCQARQKMRHTAFEEMNRHLLNHIDKNWPQARELGWRLIAADGSTMTLPEAKELRDYFGTSSGEAGARVRPMARLGFLYEVVNGLFLDAKVVPITVGEREILKNQLHLLREYDILLLDRGYPAFWLFASLSETPAEFIARLPTESWKTVCAPFIASGAREAIVTLVPDHDAIKVCEENRVCAEPIKVRLVRVDLPGGVVEVVATSILDGKAFPAELIGEIYGDRYTVEFGIRTVKFPCAITRVNGMKPELVRQHVAATVLTLNLASAMALAAQTEVDARTNQGKHKMQINLTQALSTLRAGGAVVLWLAQKIKQNVNQLLQTFLGSLSIIRPKRTAKRQKSIVAGAYPSIQYQPIS